MSKLEKEEAKELKKWCKDNDVILLHFPNEGKSFKNKMHCKKTGISDYFIPIVTTKKPGLWIELKRIDFNLKSLSNEQKNWLDKMNNQGYVAKVCCGAEDAIATIKKYLAAE